jgi:hypothetical protein
MNPFNATHLGKTGLKVGRPGVAASYGAPAEAFEEAFEMGCNYFYWGSKRKSGMRQAIINICRRGKRDELVVLIQSYSRSPFLMEVFFKSASNCKSAYSFLLGEEAFDFKILYLLQAVFQCPGLRITGALKFLAGDDIYQVGHGHEFSSQRSGLCFVHIDID